MRSIRRSLILYFLVLLGLGFCAVGVVVDQFVREAGHAREEAEVGRVIQEYDVRRREMLERFDDEMRDQAKALGREFNTSFGLLAQRDEELRREFSILMGLMPLGDAASGWPTAVTFSATLSRNSRFSLFWAYLSGMRDEIIRNSFEDYEYTNLFQFHFARSKRVIHGPNPGPELPLDVDALNRLPELDSRAEEVEIAGGGRVRRVVHRQTLSQFRGYIIDPGGWWPRTSPPPSGPRPESSSRRPPDIRRGGGDTSPVVYVQVGRDTAELERRFAREQVEQDKERNRIRRETQAATTRLRSRLALIGLTTFIALPVGGWLLIGRGLQPLRRLTDAVSRVSERDFRLPVEPSQLSYELLPIHARISDTFDDLRRAFEREKQSVADISHELRTPVAGMLATLDVTLRKPRDAAQYRNALEETRAIGRQLAGLVERVMKLATLDAGADRMSIVEFDLSEIAKGCAAVIRPIAVVNNLSFEADVSRPVSVLSDPDKLREVMINLLHNSVEYNRPGGTIRLSVRSLSGGKVQVEVADTGIGMTPDVRHRIFERFFRADASRHAAGAHAGLGLSIVKEYVQQLGGEITVESEAGVGSTFRLTLPAALPVAGTGAQADAAGAFTSEPALFPAPQGGRVPEVTAAAGRPKS